MIQNTGSTIGRSRREIHAERCARQAHLPNTAARKSPIIDAWRTPMKAKHGFQRRGQTQAGYAGTDGDTPYDFC